MVEAYRNLTAIGCKWEDQNIKDIISILEDMEGTKDVIPQRNTVNVSNVVNPL